MSFSPPGHRRDVLERWSATLLFTALLCLFLSLLRRAWSEDSTVGLVAFGFLAALFSASWVVSVVQAARVTARAGGGSAGANVTH